MLEEKIDVISDLTGKYTSVSSAESLSSGSLAYALSMLNGSDLWQSYRGSDLTYNTQRKIDLLSVDPCVIEEESIVCESVAAQMAEGMNKTRGSIYSLSTTGWAGPTGDNVGTVCCAVSEYGVETNTYTFSFSGTREDIEKKSTLGALELFIDHLKGEYRENLSEIVEQEYQNLSKESKDDCLSLWAAQSSKLMALSGKSLSVVDGLSNGDFSFNISTVPFIGWYHGGRVETKSTFLKYSKHYYDDSFKDLALNAANKIKDDFKTDIGLAISPKNQEGEYFIALVTDEQKWIQSYSEKICDGDVCLDTTDEVTVNTFELVITSLLSDFGVKMPKNPIEREMVLQYFRENVDTSTSLGYDQKEK